MLQSYLDGQVDELTTARVQAHLDDCRRCGLEAHVYEELKLALARRAPTLDPEMVERVRTFGSDLLAHPPDAAAGPPTG